MHEMEADYGTGGNNSNNEHENRMMLHSAMKNERSRQQLAKMDDELRLLKEADDVVLDLEGIKGSFMEVVEKVSDREKSIALMETTVNKLLKNTEGQIARQQKKQGLKNKVRDVDEEIKQIL
jgi:23S rRNA U2552 (ribose-2'-O)-methylase RlmE/FtsJ